VIVRGLHDALGLFVVLMMACGPSKEPTTAAPASKHQGVLRFYPFDVGSGWSFMTRDIVGGPGQLTVTTVIAFDGKTAVLDTGGQARTYRVAADGIVREPSHSYLLRWPVTLGDKWPGSGGSVVEVSKVDAPVTVDAGSYQGCVETTETFSGDRAGTIRTTFCPDVGPVLVEVRESVALGEAPRVLIGRLRWYGTAADAPKK